MNKIRRLKFFIAVVMLVIVDQVTKFVVVAHRGEFPKKIINGILSFTYCENRGIAFGFASGHVRFFSIVTLCIIAAIIVLICLKFDKIGKWSSIGAAFLISGGMGNLIDRAFRSYVVDFIDVGELFNFPIFNFADICVVVGVIFIGLSCFFDNGGNNIEKNNS